MASTPGVISVSSATASSFSSLRRRLPHPHNFLNPPTLTAPEVAASFRFFPMTTSHPASYNLRNRASKPEREGNPSILSRDPNSSAISSFQEDANYLWKLAVGSVIGAAIIKYGCIVFPDITRPDIVQALLMISAPAVASVILMILGSRQK